MTRDPLPSETLAETLYGESRRQTRAVPPRRRRLAGLTAAALALSVVFADATAVRADDNDDLLAALAALAAIGVIVGTVDNDRDAPPHHGRPYRPHPPKAHPPGHRTRLPAACAIEIEGRDHREVVLYSERCLDRAGIDRLPQRCAREIRIEGRRDRVYGEACLRDAGYRVRAPLRTEFERPD